MFARRINFDQAALTEPVMGPGLKIICSCLLMLETFTAGYTQTAYLDSLPVLIRLEKNMAKMDNKTKAGGFGGFESGYTIEGERAPSRLLTGERFTFIYTDERAGANDPATQDSMLRANGVDPSMMSGMRMDPSNIITLYKTEIAKNQRKILLQKAGGAFGSKKIKSSEKYSFSVKRIRNGYWELVIDKTLPRGEYAFNMMSMGAGNLDGSTTIYAFGID